MDAYDVCRATIAGVAKRFVIDGTEAALGRKAQQNHARKVTGEAEAKIGMIACSDPPEGRDRWRMQMIADKLIQMHVVDYCSIPSEIELALGLDFRMAALSSLPCENPAPSPNPTPRRMEH